MHRCIHLRWLRGVVASQVALLACSCSSNVVLRRAPAYDSGPLGAFRRCASNEAPCETDPIYDSSRLNASNTRFFRLPDCRYGIHDILIEDSGSADAIVAVRCAAPGPDDAATPQPGSGAAAAQTGLPTTIPGGGVSY